MAMLRPSMVDCLNHILEKEGTCLRYRELQCDGNRITYRLIVKDPYINEEHQPCLEVCSDFEEKVRGFFRHYGVETLDYTNTVQTITATKE